MNRELNAKKFIARHPVPRKRDSNGTQKSGRNIPFKRINSKGKDLKQTLGQITSSRGRSRGRGVAGQKGEKAGKTGTKLSRRGSQGSDTERASSTKKGYSDNYLKQVSESIRKSNRSTKRKSNTTNREKSTKKKREKSTKKSRATSKSSQPKKVSKTKRTGKSTPKIKKPKLQVQGKGKKDTPTPSTKTFESRRQQKMRPSIINKNGLSRISEVTQERNTNLDSRDGLYFPGSQIHVMNSFTIPQHSGEGINFMMQNQSRMSGVASSTNQFNFNRKIRNALGTSLMLRKSLKKFGKTWSSKPKQNFPVEESQGGLSKTINLKKLKIRKNPKYNKNKGLQALASFVNMYKDKFDKEKQSKLEAYSSAIKNREQNFSLKSQKAKKSESMFHPKKAPMLARASSLNNRKSLSSISKKNKMIPQTSKAKNLINKIEEEEDEGLGTSQNDPNKSTRKIFHIKKDEPVKLIKKDTSTAKSTTNQKTPIKLTKGPSKPLIPKTVVSTNNIDFSSKTGLSEGGGMSGLISKETNNISHFGNMVESKTISKNGTFSAQVLKEQSLFDLTDNTVITAGISVLKKEISEDLQNAIQGNWNGGPNSMIGAPQESKMMNDTQGSDRTTGVKPDSELWYLQKGKEKQNMEELMRNNNMQLQNLDFSTKTGNSSSGPNPPKNNLGISSENIKYLVENIPDSSDRNIMQPDPNLTGILNGKPASFEKTENLGKTAGFDQTLGDLLSQGNKTVGRTQDLNDLLSNLQSKQVQQRSFQTSQQLNSKGRDMVKKKMTEQNLTVNSGNVIHEVRSSQATGGTTFGSLPESKDSMVLPDRNHNNMLSMNVGNMIHEEEMEMVMDDDFSFPTNQHNLMVESNIPGVTINKGQDASDYQMSHLLDQTDHFQHSKNMHTYNLGSLGSFDKIESFSKLKKPDYKDKANESANIDMMLDELTAGGHSESLKRGDTVKEKKEEADLYGVYDNIEREIKGRTSETDLQNLVKENAKEMQNEGLTSMNLANFGNFSSAQERGIYDQLKSNTSGVIGDYDEDDNKVNMTLNMTMNNTMNNTMNMTINTLQHSGLQPGQGLLSGVAHNESNMDLIKKQMNPNISMMSGLQWNDSTVGHLQGASRFQSNTDDSLNMVLKGPDFSTNHFGTAQSREEDFAVKMSDNQSFHFMKKDDYFNNRFGTQNQSGNQNEYSILKDPLDDDKPKGISNIKGITARDEYGTNQSNFEATKNKFDSNQLEHSNYADSQYRPVNEDEPDNMVCGPELKDMEIKYPELNKQAYNLTDSSINMGNTFQSNQDFSIMEDSRVIGGKVIGKNGADMSYNLGLKDFSGTGLLSQNSSMTDPQRTILNKLGQFPPVNGE